MKIKEVIKAKDLNEALLSLDKYRDKSKLIAGGTDIVIDLKHKKVLPEVLIDISDVEELSQIKIEESYVEIGAAVTFTKIEKSKKLDNRLKGLKEASRLVGSPQIRNLGTIGGNICNVSPAADTVPPLLALDSIAVVMSVEGKREVPLQELFLDKGKIDLKENELLHSIKFSKLQKNQALGFSKLGLRKALAISRIATSVCIEIDEDNRCKEIRIGSGALGKYGLREKSTEDFIRDKILDENFIEESARFLKSEIEKRLEGRSSKEFKSEAVMGTFKKAIREAIQLIKA
ncbi:FAD binding domain-containing protein [Sporosalibacterium faouarense]|uniref:FAD binding domain-containing protein n=1 Tax=Sporosalibacterium faouarense TaxID=516123 RepID=UPI00192BBC37|nr:FAD binding domain-containing protein [Sporosalibacterium faouarense]